MARPSPLRTTTQGSSTGSAYGMPPADREMGEQGAQGDPSGHEGNSGDSAPVALKSTWA